MWHSWTTCTGYDQECSWWAKLRHAADHHERLVALCDDFRSRKPFEVVEKETPDPSVTMFVFWQYEPIPNDISLTVGDVLHCLRSALDSLVYGIVEGEVGAPTEQQERACQFPIEATPVGFDNFIGGHGVRAKLYSHPLRAALRASNDQNLWMVLGSVTWRSAPSRG